jgi:hypothetical protein
VRSTIQYMKAMFSHANIVRVAIFLASVAAGCLMVSSRFGSTKSTHEHPPPQRNVRRALLKWDNNEMVRFFNDPKTTHTRASDATDGVRSDDFVWDDINYTQTPLCGGMKCFFRSTSDPTRGYLIWDATYGDSEPGLQLSAAMAAYDYAANLQSECGIRHFAESPPVEIESPEYFKSQLNSGYLERHLDSESLIVEPSRTAPEGSIIFRCYNDRVLDKRLKYVIEELSQQEKQRLKQELKNTKSVVESHPGLMNDFQLMIDLEGRIHHLDFDRAVKPLHANAERIFKGCLESALALVRESMDQPQIDQ